MCLDFHESAIPTAGLLRWGYSFTFTVSHAERTASCAGESAPKSSLAEAAVARAKAPNVAFGDSVPPDRVSYQICPGASQALPPRAVATRQNARFGMPELMCTPPLSALVRTYESIESGWGSFPRTSS